ncbi:hypothetical protein [Nocardioides sp. WS12]|uniref:hypothetical protein n=1 Tax=Nocardioides sp. WS12 TaxID=2486272 RepID=UPI00191FED74|nr:hypothetical protein [Nocardioides sp. WS12]
MCNHKNREQAMTVLDEKTWCDPCIAPLIKALNDGGLRTIASCCGHEHGPGNVMLVDGRVLIVLPDREWGDWIAQRIFERTGPMPGTTLTTAQANEQWSDRPRFALDADVTVYWPTVRPEYDAAPINLCKNCGRDAGPDVPTPDHCSSCPPWTCDGCGQTTSMADPCSCWIPLDGLPVADIKALLALGDLSVDATTPGTEGCGHPNHGNDDHNCLPFLPQCMAPEGGPGYHRHHTCQGVRGHIGEHFYRARHQGMCRWADR